MNAIQLCNQRTRIRGPDLDHAGAYLLMTVAGGSVGISAEPEALYVASSFETQHY